MSSASTITSTITAVSASAVTYSIDSRLINTSLLNNRLRALAKEEQVENIGLLRGRKKVLIYTLLARE